MPRAGGVYSAPPGTKGSPNTTIESAKYNALVDDLVADANAARPVTAGGSGSNTAVGGADAFSPAGADMASAATVNLANSTGTLINVTGTVTITALGTIAAGAERVLVFAGALTLTHNATSLILPGAANITTAAGDIAVMRSLGGGNWRCIGYQRANGQPIGALTQPTLTLKQSAAPTPTAEGDIQWDTDDNVLVIGDGAAQQIFVSLPASVAAGDVFYATGAKALARLPKGTAGQVLQMNAGATAPQWANVPFIKTYESAQQTWTNGGTLTLAHGLGVQPKMYHAYAVCIAAGGDGGYALNDEILLATWASDAADGRGVNLRPDATNITVYMGSNGLVMVSTTGGYNYKSNPASTWKLIIRAWA
ncbi:hypothetical protein [Mesorhizobium australafricanum]|uniref:Uncharacterized protein n=1 Tax=Mesorhizobium australafricanum TaxID=3072311 RepID=A0ABU4WQP6_9HYPH|nr:hypothetical protein [Mesorhizobium sp. VK3E]MDX8438341.1 hypothetical protein [Mesorhizobium sp. VK3E]